MSRDDLIYAFLLLLAIGFGHFYRKIRDVASKQLIGTGLGLAMLFFTSKGHCIHLFFTFFTCCAIIKLYREKCHLVCFWFMMTYLLFFRTLHLFNLPVPPTHTNMIQMIMTLKIIGLAFERNAVFTKTRDADKGINADKGITLTAAERDIQDISVMSMFHYCFNYIGLLTGPYYTYKTFYDFFNYPFAINADTWKVTLDKLRWVPLYTALFLLAGYIWPLDYALSDEFYLSRSWLYRLFYVWPTFFIYRMRIYAGIVLSECLCTSAGLGAYPKELESKCGHGPSKDVTRDIIEKPEDREYDFETVKNINVSGVESCILFREAMKNWNMCVQFFLAMYIYKRFPSKKYRVMATMAVSAYWHGIHPGHYFCILGPIVYLPLEDLYTKVFKSETRPAHQQKVINAIFWILKFFAFSYMGTAFVLSSVDKIWFFYTSVYHFAYVFWAVAYIVCLLLWQQKKRAMKKAAKLSEISLSVTPIETKKVN